MSVLTPAQTRIHSLLRAILQVFEAGRDQPGVDQVLEALAQMDLSAGAMKNMAPQGARHDPVLRRAIAGVTAPGLHDLALALAAARPDLVWREDEGLYYAPGADLGAGYKDCNLHSLLIGPGGCAYEHPDFCLGIFMLGPRTLYRDHAHAAPELYLNLSPRTGWRFLPGDWRDVPAGSFVWNAPGVCHATRVYQQPFLSVFVWLRDVDQPCHVVPADDWGQIERELAELPS